MTLMSPSRVMRRRGFDPGKLDDPHAFIDELARRDFVSFVIRAFPYLHGGANLDHNWHLDAIAFQLTRVRTGRCRRMLITLPPRNLKSFMISVAWVAWCLGHNPTLNFVCVSYSNELAAKLARDCRSIVQSNWYRRLFPRTIIAASRSAAHDFETTSGGGRLATSVGGTLTGRGGDIIIIDDPIKPDEAMSDTTRQSVNEWFHTTLASRLNDKRNGAIITVMQRLHQYDLAGQLLESGEWDELSLPAIAIEDGEIPLTRGRTYKRIAGEALHPSRDPLEVLLRIKASIGSVIFSAQYQQQPVPAEGNMIRADWLMQTYRADLDRSLGAQVVQSYDTASKDGLLNDWSVGITALVRNQDVFILDVWRKKVEFPELLKAVSDNARRHHANVLLIEDQASGEALIQTLRNKTPHGVPRPTARKPEADKKTRVSAIGAMLERGQLHLPADAPWLSDFKQELLAFPNGRHDDQVDALSQLLIWVDLQQRFDTGPIVGPVVIGPYGEIEPDDVFDEDDPWGVPTDPLY